MGAFDWLSGAKTVTPVDFSNIPLPKENVFLKLLGDPNMQQMMMQMGARIGGPGSAGEAIGVPASNMLRAKQMAEATEKQDQGFMSQMLNALGGGDLSKLPVTAQGDPSGIDSITVNDKGVIVKMPRPGTSSAYGSNELPETQTGGSKLAQTSTSAPVSQPSVGGQDLLPFFRGLLGYQLKI